MALEGLGRAPAVREPTVALVPLLGVLWGLNWPAVRMCLTEMSPWTLRCLGFAFGTAVMVVALRVRGASLSVPRAHWGRLVLVGLFTVLAYNMLTAFAQLSTTTARSAVLSYTMPVWTVLLAWLFLREPLDGRRLLGLTLGLGGLVALGWPLVVAGELSWGLLFAVLSGVAWAVGNTVLKRFPIQADSSVITTWQLMMGAVVTSVGMAAEGGTSFSSWSWPVTAWFTYHVLFAQAAAMTLWYVILNRLPAGIAGIGSLLVPAVGVISAATLLGEHPSLADWIGLVLIVAASASVLVRLPSAADR